MAKRKNSTSPVATSPVATSPVVATMAIINVCLSALLTLSKGKVFPTPWIEWTPIGGDGKPLDKRAEEGIVDVNRLLKGSAIVKPSEKTIAAQLMQQWLVTPPTEGVIVGSNGVGTPVSHLLKSALTVGQTLVLMAQERGVRVFHHARNWDWSGVDSTTGRTMFGLGSDWPLLQKRWNETKGNAKEVEKMYGFLPWGQPLMSRMNVLSQVENGIKAGFDLVPIVKQGRGRGAKIVVSSDFSLEDFEAFAENLGKPTE